MPGVRVSTRNAMGRGTRRHSTVIISACLIFMGFECGSGEENCYGFKNSIVTFSLVEEFHEDSPYQNESAPWPHGIKDAAREAVGCGLDDVPPNPIRVEERGRWPNSLGCDNHFGTLIDGDGLDFPHDGDRPIHDLTTWLASAIRSTDLISSGRREIFAGCLGWYSILLYSGSQYYAGATVPEDELFEPPTPGIPPNWLVLRIFEPDEECEGLDLGDDPNVTWCADTWVAQVMSIEPR